VSLQIHVDFEILGESADIVVVRFPSNVIPMDLGVHGTTII